MGSPDLFVTGLGRKLVVFHLPPVLTKLFNMCNMSMSVNDCQCILHEASRVHQNWNPVKDCTSCRMSCTMLQTARDSNTFCCSAPPNFVLRNNSERRQTSRWNPAVAVGCRVCVARPPVASNTTTADRKTKDGMFVTPEIAGTSNPWQDGMTDLWNE